MKAEEMVRVIKNQFFLFGNPGGVNILIAHLHVLILPRGILSFVDSQDTGGPLPSFREPFGLKVLRSDVSDVVIGPSLGGLLTSLKCRKGKKTFAVQKTAVHWCLSSYGCFRCGQHRGRSGRDCAGGNPPPTVLAGRRAAMNTSALARAEEQPGFLPFICRD